MADVVIDTWLPQTWYGTQPTSGAYVWTDGTTIYHTNQSGETYKLNEQTSTWERKIWDLPFTMTQGNWNYIWTAGSDIYYSDGNASHHLKYNKTTDTWESITWTGYTNIRGSEIWTDGIDYYFSIGSVQYVINLQTREVTRMTWNGYTQPHGGYIWHCGEVIYNSDGGAQYVLDVATHTWIAKTWNGSFQRPSGYDVWTDGYYYYYSNANNPYNIMEYRLNLETDTWEQMVWKGENRIDGENVWKCGYDIYFSGSAGQWKLDLPEPPEPPEPTDEKPVFRYTKVIQDGVEKPRWVRSSYIYTRTDGAWTSGSGGRAPIELDGWLPQDWGENYPRAGTGVWKDEDHLYYTAGIYSYEYDFRTKKWVEKTWNGLNITVYDGDGSYMWTDGINRYYSSNYYGNKQYVLDRATDTWYTKNWNGLSSFKGLYVWTDGQNIYYSGGSNQQYVLDVATSTWLPKTWNGNVASLQGDCIWFEGDNIYYASAWDGSFVLDKETSTWLPKTWYGVARPDGVHVWSDGTNFYFSDGPASSQFVLDKATDTWLPKTWTGLDNFSGNWIWTDGEKIFYSQGTNQYYATGVPGPTPPGSIKPVYYYENGAWIAGSYVALYTHNEEPIWATDASLYCTSHDD